ncbi:MAG TPA: hypothetical protein VGR63_19250 [Casimicrobiaceae bacterium]|jgi:hypothetical protein|nr:hypothetical protein [Casimicrobiaceae bacterium]
MGGKVAAKAAIKPVEEEPATDYGRVEPPNWDTVGIVGGGPSLIDFDFERLRGATILAVKGSLFSIPWADAGFGMDMIRYGEWRDRLAGLPTRVYWAAHDGQLDPAPPRNVTFLHRREGRAVSDDPGVVYSGGTSGFGALQIALLKRAKRIVLFGFDYGGAGESDPRRARSWLIWAEQFRVFVPYLTAAGVNIVNACPHSAIPCFQKATLDDGVRALTRP